MDEKNINEILGLCKENNKILRGMRRSQRWTSLMSILYWIFIIGSITGAYYLLQPMIDTIKQQYDNTISKLNNVGKIGDNLSNTDISPEMIDGLKKTLNMD